MSWRAYFNVLQLISMVVRGIIFTDRNALDVKRNSAPSISRYFPLRVEVGEGVLVLLIGHHVQIFSPNPCIGGSEGVRSL